MDCEALSANGPRLLAFFFETDTQYVNRCLRMSAGTCLCVNRCTSISVCVGGGGGGQGGGTPELSVDMTAVRRRL